LSAQVFERLDTEFLRKLVVQLSLNISVDLVDLTLEYSVFACKVRSTVLLRESNIYRHVLAGFVADQLILKTWDELTRAEFQTEIRCFTALEGFTINETFEIHDHDIAGLGGTVFLDLFGRAVVAREFLKPVFDLVVGDRRFVAGCLDRREIDRFNLRHDFYAHLVDEVRAGIEGFDLDLRLHCGLQRTFREHRIAGFGDHCFQHFTQNRVSEALAKDFHRNLAWSEAWHVYGLPNLGQLRFDFLVDFRSFNRNREFTAQPFILCLYYLHG